MSIGVPEFSWAGSTLASIPLLALLIERSGWRAPFLYNVVGYIELLFFRRIILETAKAKSYLRFQKA